MGWEDRDYYRERPSGPPGVISWLLYGSVPLFTAFGIRVRAHASLIVLIAIWLLFGVSRGEPLSSRVQGLTALFCVILLHEFGHCFAARWTGGQANDILMTPLGGLAMTMARQKPWPRFITVAGGPAVNVIICVVCGLGLFLTTRWWPLGPWQFGNVDEHVEQGWLEVAAYLYWVYLISYGLLLFNLLPIFPLDGGQLLQSILWKPMGYYKSMMLVLNIGLAGSVLLVLSGFGLISIFGGGYLMAFIGVNCFMNCLMTKKAMQAEGPWAFTEQDAPDYADGWGGSGGSGNWGGGVATREKTTKPKEPGYFARRRAEKEARTEADEQTTVDQILAKVSATGMNSLTDAERNALKQASENQRKRDEARATAKKKSLGL